MTEQLNFFILTMPRCRSAWFANLFTTDTTWCGHEVLAAKRGFESPAGYRVAGASGSDVPLYAESLAEEYRRARFVSVTRDPADVARSLRRQGLVAPLGAVEILKERVDQFAMRHGALRLDFDDLTEGRIRELWRWCTRGDSGLPQERLDMLMHFNVQAEEPLPGHHRRRVS